MGDYRLSVEITLVGEGGKHTKIDWWVNWWPDKPELLYRELVKKAKEVGLEVYDKTCLLNGEEEY